MAICGDCGRELAALTSNGFCLQCDMKQTQKMRMNKNTFLKIIHDNDFNLKLISQITKKPEQYIKEFIQSNNIKRIEKNNYTCVRCNCETDQLYTKNEVTGLCLKCVDKITKSKQYHNKIKETKSVSEVSVIENTKPNLKDKPMKNIKKEFIEPLTLRKPGRPKK